MPRSLRPRSKSSPCLSSLSLSIPSLPPIDLSPSLLLSSLDLGGVDLKNVSMPGGEEVVEGFRIFLEELVRTIKELLESEGEGGGESVFPVEDEESSYEDEEDQVAEKDRQGDAEEDSDADSDTEKSTPSSSFSSDNSNSSPFISTPSLRSIPLPDLHQLDISSLLSLFSSSKLSLTHSIDPSSDSLRDAAREYLSHQRENLRDYLIQRRIIAIESGRELGERGMRGIEELKESLGESLSTLECKLSSLRNDSSVISYQLLEEFKSLFPSLSVDGIDGKESLASLRRYFLEESEKLGSREEERRYGKAVREGAKRWLSYEELPKEWRNNKWIVGGYRFIEHTSISSLLLPSFFSLHNETFNIHTHFLPSLLLIPLICTSCLSLPLPKLIFLISAFVCLGSSTGFHVCCGSSNMWVMQHSTKGDYLGISILITGSVGSITWEPFSHSHPFLKYGALTIFSLVALLGTIVPVLPSFDKNKDFRIVFYLSLVFALCSPVITLMYISGPTLVLSYFSPVLPSIYSYLLGLVFYATNFPECLRPGTFDIVGHSHQWWHIGILGGVWGHWRALEEVGRVGWEGGR